MDTATTNELTTNEALYLVAIATSDYHDGNNPVGNEVWTWDVVEGSGLKPRTCSGVASSLVKKGLIVANNLGPKAEHTTHLTEAGWNIARFLIYKTSTFEPISNMHR